MDLQEKLNLVLAVLPPPFFALISRSMQEQLNAGSFRTCGPCHMGGEVISTPLVGKDASLMNLGVETELVGTPANSIRPHPIAFG